MKRDGKCSAGLQAGISPILHPRALRRAFGCETLPYRGTVFPEGRRAVTKFNRITLDPMVMGGKPCIRGLRVTVGTIVGLMASGHSNVEILRAYPYLVEEDLREALAYAAWRVEEVEVPLSRS